MKDKNQKEIQVGDLVKKQGLVKYADGERMKVSRKTWQVSKIENGQPYYQETITDWQGKEVVQDVPITCADGIELVVVGDAKGISKEYKNQAKMLAIEPGTVAENYRVLKEVTQYNWKEGEIVKIVGKVSFETLEKGYLEKVEPNVKHKHVLVVADPARVGVTNN